MVRAWAKRSWHRRRNLKQPEEETQRPPPPPRILPAHRPRALTLSSSSYISATRKVIGDQSKCVLLGKLPSELRQMIWRECIGGVHAYHLDTVRSKYTERLIVVNRKICRLRGFCNGLDGSGIPCHSEDDYNSMKRVPAASNRKIGMVSMLLSCRQV